MRQESPYGFWITVFFIGVLAAIGITADFVTPEPGGISRTPPMLASVPVKEASLGNTIAVKPETLEPGGGVSDSDQGLKQEFFVRVFTPPEPFPVRDPSHDDPPLTAQSAIAVLFPNERVLFSKNEQGEFPPASITKLATALSAREFLKPEDVLTVSKQAVLTMGEAGRLIVGEKLSFHDLLALALIPSSNDAAFAIADAIGIERLMERMNEEADELGMTQTQFLNPTGLHAPGHITSARDLVMLGKAAFADPVLRAMMAQYTMDIASSDGKFQHHLVSTNILLEEIPEMLGGKTGYTEEAGQTMLAIFQPPAPYKDRVTEETFLITVVLGSQDRIGDTRTLFQWLKEAYRW